MGGYKKTNEGKKITNLKINKIKGYAVGIHDGSAGAGRGGPRGSIVRAVVWHFTHGYPHNGLSVWRYSHSSS
jgi:hypothetical protein